MRDKIPEIIRSTGQEPEVTVAMGGVNRELLVAKMQEELAEFVEDTCEEEAADMLEVFRFDEHVQLFLVRDVERLAFDPGHGQGFPLAAHRRVQHRPHSFEQMRKLQVVSRPGEV